MRNYYVPGEWNVICDRCGFEHKASHLRKEWTGLMVCGSCWESRHPQTLIQVRGESGAPPWTRPEPEDTFITVSEIILTESHIPIQTEDGPPLFTEGDT